MTEMEKNTQPKWVQDTCRIFGLDHLERIVSYSRKNWPEDVAHVMRVADAACENSFLFDFPWDMEQTNQPMIFEDKIDWSSIPRGDREFLWQFNRHRFLLCLAEAYQMTKDEKYAKNYVRLLADWIDHAKPGENIGLGPWRTLETGIRPETWLRTVPLVLESDMVDAIFLQKVYDCLKKHQNRLLTNFDDHKYISNWGVLESEGLFLLSLVLPDSKEVLQTALTRLCKAAAIQVLPDGMQWEQSPMYHNEVYHGYLAVLFYGQRAGILMPDIICKTVENMAYVNYKWMKPDHTQFAQGDSDTTDLRDQISAGALILKDEMLKSGGYENLDFDNIWLFGDDGRCIYETLGAQEPDFLSLELPFGGNYYFRSGWDENANLLHFHCGDTGGGHGHADKLHFDLVICGEDLLVDSGRYTYVDGSERFLFKEAGAHNVTLVDGRGFAPCDTSWIYQKLCTCVKQEFYDGSLAGYVEGSHLGYWEDSVIVNKKIIWIKPDIYIICDNYLSHGSHLYENHLHFSGHGTVEDLAGDLHFTGDEMEAYVQFVTPQTGEIRHTWQSFHYNEKHQNQTYVGTVQTNDSFHQITVINGSKKGKTSKVQVKNINLRLSGYERDLDRSQAEGLQIISGQKEYVLFLCHQEVMTPTDILCWENCRGYGKTVLFDRSMEKDEIIAGEILSW